MICADDAYCFDAFMMVHVDYLPVKRCTEIAVSLDLAIGLKIVLRYAVRLGLLRSSHS